MGVLSELRIIAVLDGSDRRILFRFSPDHEIEAIIRQLPGCIWSESRQGWQIPNNPENLRQIFKSFKGRAYIDASGVFKPEKEYVQALVQKQNSKVPDNPAASLPLLSLDKNKRIEDFVLWMKQRRYSENTIRTYTEGIRTFLRYHSGKAVESITNVDLEDFNGGFILKNGYSASYQNQVINAVKLFFRKMEKREMEVEEIERPRKEEHLPNVLSKKEVKDILGAPVNLKHRVMLSLIYACGLRRSELLDLKPEDIESQRGLLVIRQSKGNKDRVVPISAKLVEMLREYYKAYRPKTWLFEGQIRGEQYSPTSLQEVLKKSVVKAGIRKPVTLHWLRHSYATHLLESGTDLRYIQELLGHKSSRTTEIYTHVSQKSIQQIKSPFDDL